ncbi:hypothetical protein HK100_004341 [Physocladia obscura]|uniref:J domain-containing protein n=1 Tax=Physocladia obscura TaxID=109957 RepID=A0AAD5SUI9_9FUNG|nr:hypothetical protein HK100_004341 [Physocladia obscura]
MQCHYEVLGVPRSANADELKKAYRRKALELHPDKNPDRIDQATQLFAQVQNAYQLLSDPHERSWYDAHRDEILRGNDLSFSGNANDSGPYMSISSLMHYFSPSAFSGFVFSDPKSFYSVNASIFTRIIQEEFDAAATEQSAVSFDPIDENAIETFRASHTEYPSQFYAYFLAFSTIKSFRNRDKHNLATAPDRRVRRAMEATNLKLRANGRKEFNLTVRELALYTQKRDPRYAAMRAREIEDRDRRAKENEDRKRREKEARIVMVETWQEQDWMNSNDGKKSSDSNGSDDDVELNEFWCAACSKLFKSDRQWENHEKSKKHQESVAVLRQQLLAEEYYVISNELQSLDDETTETLEFITQDIHNFDISAVPVSNNRSKEKKKGKKKAPNTGFAGFVRMDLAAEENYVEETSQQDRKQKPKGGYANLYDGIESPIVTPNEKATSDGEESTLQKLSAKDKKKLREAKKKEKAQKDQITCAVCGIEFEGRNKLFEHLEDSGHATVEETTRRKK